MAKPAVPGGGLRVAVSARRWLLQTILCGASHRSRRMEELRSVVQRLGETGEEGAAEVRILARNNPHFRQALAMLGAIPPLIASLQSHDSASLIASLYALLNLAVGNQLNKSAIVKEGAVRKMESLIESEHHPGVADAVIANFLSLSALDANKLIIGASSVAIRFLVRSIGNPNPRSKDDALRALCNLSSAPANAGSLIEAGIVPCLLSAIADDFEASERALSVLSNLVGGSPEGRQAVRSAGEALSVLIEVLSWSDFPECQEKALYVLMVMAHRSNGGGRASMVAAGITSALLELTLVGSPLAQKRAARVLEILRDERGKQVVIISKPIVDWSGAQREVEGMSEENRAVKRLVKESLMINMRRIARRANFPPEFGPPDQFRPSTSRACHFGSDVV